MPIYGYARVSSTDQNADRQVLALRGAGAKFLFIDKQSGRDFEREKYQQLVGQLQAGDIKKTDKHMSVGLVFNS